MGLINISSLVCIVYLQIYNVINTQICSSINRTDVCCSGYKWSNEKEKCIPCRKGYNGIHCENRCVAPFYGFDCQFECKCKKEDCHYAEGCKHTYNTEQISSHTTPKYVKNTAEGNIEMIDEKDNLRCPIIHKRASKETTPMVVGIIVLAAVAFIISLTILFTYQIEKRQRLRNCRERNV